MRREEANATILRMALLRSTLMKLQPQVLCESKSHLTQVDIHRVTI